MGRVDRLSSREIEILKRLVHGEPNKQISRRLDISETTVKVHVKAILRKIRVSNRTQAAIWGLDNLFGANGACASSDSTPAAPDPSPVYNGLPPMAVDVPRNGHARSVRRASTA
jgi:two-component system nitrate/nitrite response regulator NarL